MTVFNSCTVFEETARPLAHTAKTTTTAYRIKKPPNHLRDGTAAEAKLAISTES